MSGEAQWQQNGQVKHVEMEMPIWKHHSSPREASSPIRLQKLQDVCMQFYGQMHPQSAPQRWCEIILVNDLSAWNIKGLLWNRALEVVEAAPKVQWMETWSQQPDKFRLAYWRPELGSRKLVCVNASWLPLSAKSFLCLCGRVPERVESRDSGEWEKNEQVIALCRPGRGKPSKTDLWEAEAEADIYIGTEMGTGSDDDDFN